jgi:hypothetical protein
MAQGDTITSGLYELDRLTLVTQSEGLALYAFTFGSCLAPEMEGGGA